MMAPSKLITIKIDPNLDRMWKAIGHSPKERSAQIQALESALLQCYQNFMAQTHATVEELRLELKQAQDEFRQTQRIYGDTNAQIPSNPGLCLPEQIVITKQATAELQQIYQVRLQEFDRVHTEVTDLFAELGIEGEDRGEFGEIGNEDYTVERLNRFKGTIKSLKADREQRRKLFASLQARIEKLLEELNEKVGDDVQKVLEGQIITNEALKLLNEYLESLQELKEGRESEIETWTQELEHLYAVLMVDPSDQMLRETAPTQEVVDKLKTEVEFLRGQRETRLPHVIKGATKEIAKLCEQLRIPLRLRPKSPGGTLEEEATFLTQQVDLLRQKRIQCQPIIELITQIESCRDTLDGPSARMRETKPSAKKALGEEKAKRTARERLPKLERKLLSLLVEFKEKNGYDFEFNGVTTYRPSFQTEEGEDGTNHGGRRGASSASPRKQPPASLGHQILMQKINESMVVPPETSSSLRTTGRRTAFTGRGPFM
jgi:hypothetical protein